MSSAAIGIDLGTSNSAVALSPDSSAPAKILPVSQLLGANQIGERPSLPSALYLPPSGAYPEDSLRMPWESGSGENPFGVVGTFARERGAEEPERLVVSAKSWLSNPHVDPRSAKLPWGSHLAEGSVSALDASRRYLTHLRNGLLHAAKIQGNSPDELEQATVVITVPASFDEIARQLTTEAAANAGFGEVILLEEPQAAFYAWTDSKGNAWRDQVSAGDVVLVCDVGGGTADFSLIAVSETDGDLGLERIAVGDHLLLGGDNMDLALAYTLQAKFEEDGHEVEDFQFLGLLHAASKAKISLFDDPDLKAVPVAVAGTGSSLLGNTLSTQLERSDLDTIVDAFFPLTEADDLPAEGGGAALQEFGLPYANDPVVTKHLSRFLKRSLLNIQSNPNLPDSLQSRLAGVSSARICPDAVLFNGGVFKATPLRGRILDCMEKWAGGVRPRELQGADPDLAVARGAAAYGRNRRHNIGLRIRAGTARSYYVGLESTRPAVPGFQPPVKALCVVPQGMEEGTELAIDQKTFGLVTGKPAVFRFFSSEIRSADAPGSIIPNAEKNLEESSKIEVALPAMEEFAAGEPIPVHLISRVTELGQLELWMQHAPSGQRWKVEFQVRMD